MSPYSDAISKLVKDPPRDQNQGPVFTEIDVVLTVSNSRWSKKRIREAFPQANQVLGTLYRARKLCRYGPVVLPGGHRDYARIGEKIVYADAETGPDFWETPNGRFPKLMIETDTLKAQGRRHGTQRNDLIPWSEQGFDIAQAQPPVPETSQEQITRLEAVIADLSTRIEGLEEKERARERIYARG
jgi:hypothetical protein